MAKVGGYTIEDIYQGGYSSFKSNYGDVFTGYHVPAASLGAPTKIDTANQIQQVDMLLRQGIVPVEVGVIDPQIFEQIPKQHFKEINRQIKLADAKISLHAPLIEPSGIGEQGWSEYQREQAEKQLTGAIERSSEMDNRGNMPVTIHSAAIPGTEYAMTPEGKKVERLIVVNQETGKVATALQEETKFYPGYGEKVTEKLWTPEEQLNNLNVTEWSNKIDQLLFQKERADEILQKNSVQIQQLIPVLQEGRLKPEDLTPIQRQTYNHIQNAGAYLGDVDTHLKALFSNAYKFGTREQRIELYGLNKDFIKEIEKKPQNIMEQVMKHSNAMQLLMEGLKKPDLIPEIFTPVEKFAIDKSSKTFGNVAFNSFDKFGEKAPVINIENMFTGMAFASGEDMNKLILKSKEQFVKRATEEGYSKSEAQRQADKLIGMTLDVGHLNIARKKGFKEEDLRKEVEAIAKHVKHIHLTDNFGYTDSHLPPGMGNVPFKEIFETLKKKGVITEEIRKIVEAGGWVQHFGTSPYPISLEALGSPVYADGVGPYWNQAIALQQGYLGGYGEMLPQMHHETWGAGFSQLPSELGGQKGGGAGGRMSGRPME